MSWLDWMPNLRFLSRLGSLSTTLVLDRRNSARCCHRRQLDTERAGDSWIMVGLNVRAVGRDDELYDTVRSGL